MQLSKPKTDLTDVLHHLITQGETSIEQFYWMSGFRTRISDIRLKLGLILVSNVKKSVNRNNRKMWYNVHTLKDKKKAIKIYNQINK